MVRFTVSETVCLVCKRTGDKEFLGAITGVTKFIIEITGFSRDQQNNSCLTGDQALIFEKRKGVLSWCCVRLQAAGYRLQR